MKTILSLALIGLATSTTAGCAADAPQEEQIVHPNIGSETPTAEASGFFKLMCPWGFYYTFCGERDTATATSADCQVYECIPVGADCGPSLSTVTYDCGDGLGTFTKQVTKGVCMQAQAGM
jgi:hypothetical protein